MSRAETHLHRSPASQQLRSSSVKVFSALDLKSFHVFDQCPLIIVRQIGAEIVALVLDEIGALVSREQFRDFNEIFRIVAGVVEFPRPVGRDGRAERSAGKLAPAPRNGVQRPLLIRSSKMSQVSSVSVSDMSYSSIILRLFR